MLLVLDVLCTYCPVGTSFSRLHLVCNFNSLLQKFSDATIYVGGLDEKVTDGILWELFVQAGPVVSVNMPKDRVTSSHQG